ncbi:MAG: MFS transporter [Nitrososphaerota archaeon]|nr:MFS transporter [Nitrososphaerota archaeon]
MDKGLSTSRWRALASTSFGHLVNDGWVTFIPLMADLIVNENQTPLAIVTLISVSFYSSSALLNFYVGHLADASGSQGKMMSMGIAIISLSYLGFDFALGHPADTLLYFAVALFSVLAGLGSAFYHPIAGSIVQNSFSFNSRGKALGVNGAFGQVGSAAFPPIFFGIALFLTQRGALALLAVFGLAASVAIWWGLGGYRNRTTAPKGERRSLRKVLTRGIVILTAITVVRAMANTGVSVWLPTYITFVRGEGVGSLLGYTIAAAFIGAIPGQLVFGALVERLDKRYVLGISSAGAGLAVLGYIWTEGAVALVFIVLFGFFSYSSFPTLLSLASDYVPAANWTAANGFVWGFGMMGGNVLGPAITQAIIGNDYARLNAAFTLLAVLGLAGAIATPLLKKGEYARANRETGRETV